MPEISPSTCIILQNPNTDALHLILQLRCTEVMFLKIIEPVGPKPESLTTRVRLLARWHHSPNSKPFTHPSSLGSNCERGLKGPLHLPLAISPTSRFPGPPHFTLSPCGPTLSALKCVNAFA